MATLKTSKELIFYIYLKSGICIIPKGFYYQGKNIIIVGDEIKNHTMRQSFKKEEIELIEIQEK